MKNFRLTPKMLAHAQYRRANGDSFIHFACAYVGKTMIACASNDRVHHAEVRLLKKLQRIKCKKRKKFDILVARVKNSTLFSGEIEFTLSKPCKNCADFLDSFEFVKSVSFTIT